MTGSSNSKTVQPANYLVNKKASEVTTEHMYDKQQVKNTRFGEVWGAESHLIRRKQILKAHPQLAKNLNADKPWSVIIASILVAINLTVAYTVKDSSWFVILTTMYVVGGTINHTLHVLVHDFTHLTGHSNVMVNKVMAIICNVSMGIPSAHSFALYHADHHNFMGERDKDPDLPSDFEVNFFKGPILKLLFFIFLSPIYAIRPFVFQHKPMTIAQKINFICILCSNLLIYKFWGIGSAVYILISGFLSVGAHPATVHAIAEHAQFVRGVQTYDYFGPWNFLNLNLGYHTQHHDFPTCPWYKLPIIRETAPQFYENLPYHTSYMKCLWKFITDDNITLNNRTIRLPETKTA